MRKRAVGCLLATFAGTGLTVAAVCVLVAAGLSSSVLTKPVCACVTLNESLAWELGGLDALVQEYAAIHGGRYPTYDELAGLVQQSRRHVRHLTPEVHYATGAFTFTPVKADAGKVGYGVSTDRRGYILLGIGLTVREEVRYLFGYKIDTRIIGYELPILRPGDEPPEPSPIL